MKSPRHNVSEDRQAILGRHSRSSNSANDVENSEPIPVDLIIDIFLRLSVKSIARCRCVSKLWTSILRLPYFTELFLTKSLARPKLLLAYKNDNELFFFSAPQPKIPDESSSPLAATYHMKIPFTGSCDIVSVINGIVLIRNQQTFKSVSVICNPSTGQSLTLPKPKTRTRIYIRSYFGYDPIKKQLKVLSMTVGGKDGISREHQVLTLGTKKLSWRMIECCIPHDPGLQGICINGVLYYRASVNNSSSNSMIVCFDVGSEKFSFIKLMEPFTRVVHHAAILINYEGKLGSLMSRGHNYTSEICRIFEMWVLKDPIKHEWSKHNYKLPPLWQDGLAEFMLHFIGVTGTNEIVLAPFHPSNPYYFFCCNTERKTCRRVEIQGMGAFKDRHMFLDHVEDVKLMEDFIP